MIHKTPDENIKAVIDLRRETGWCHLRKSHDLISLQRVASSASLGVKGGVLLRGSMLSNVVDADDAVDVSCLEKSNPYSVLSLSKSACLSL
jgi:hypothetical protein